MLRLIDSVFDRIAERIAHNICENLETVEQNRAAREAGESLPKRQVQKAVRAEKTTWIYEQAIFTA